MKMQHLIYFKTLASTNSVTLASEQLFVTQQALSKSLKAFETELGTTLFHRTNHGITLTQDGEYVLQITDKILELKHELELHFSKESALTLSENLNMMIPQHIYELYCVNVVVISISIIPIFLCNYPLAVKIPFCNHYWPMR